MAGDAHPAKGASVGGKTNDAVPPISAELAAVTGHAILEARRLRWTPF